MEDTFKKAFTPANTQETRLRRLERGTQTLRGGTVLSPSGSYGRIPLGLLDETGKIPISNSSLTKVGSVPPAAANPGFAYVSTDTTIHIYWDGTNGSNRIVIYRADGSRFAVPPGDILVTGLTASTTYYFLPFWNTDGNHCSIGFVPGTVGGGAKILFTAKTDTAALQQQTLQSHEPLSIGFVPLVTAAGGGTGGGGGIGCVMQGTDIEALGSHEWSVEVMPEMLWVRLDTKGGKSLTCSDSHRLYLEHGLVEAEAVRPGDRVVTIDGVEEIVGVHRIHKSCTKHRVRMHSGHLYWANGILSHNMKSKDEV